MTLHDLRRTTPPDEIRQRQGPRKHAGDCPKFGPCTQPHMMLDYIDARYVMDTLDDVIGQSDWQDRFEDRADGSVRCGIGIRVGDEWVWKWDVGTPSDIEPEKGSYSEAFKRAAVKWGIGRDLYGHAPARAHAPSPPRAAQQAAPSPAGDGVACPIHGVPWNGQLGDYFHKTPDGKWCRPEGQPRKPRAATGESRPPAASEPPLPEAPTDLEGLPF